MRIRFYIIIQSCTNKINLVVVAPPARYTVTGYINHLHYHFSHPLRSLFSVTLNKLVTFSTSCSPNKATLISWCPCSNRTCHLMSSSTCTEQLQRWLSRKVHQ